MHIITSKIRRKVNKKTVNGKFGTMEVRLLDTSASLYSPSSSVTKKIVQANWSSHFTV